MTAIISTVQILSNGIIIFSLTVVSIRGAGAFMSAISVKMMHSMAAMMLTLKEATGAPPPLTQGRGRGSVDHPARSFSMEEQNLISTHKAFMEVMRAAHIYMRHFAVIWRTMQRTTLTSAVVLISTEQIHAPVGRRHRNLRKTSCGITFIIPTLSIIIRVVIMPTRCAATLRIWSSSVHFMRFMTPTLGPTRWRLTRLTSTQIVAIRAAMGMNFGGIIGLMISEMSDITLEEGRRQEGPVNLLLVLHHRIYCLHSSANLLARISMMNVGTSKVTMMIIIITNNITAVHSMTLRLKVGPVILMTRMHGVPMAVHTFIIRTVILTVIHRRTVEALGRPSLTQNRRRRMHRPCPSMRTRMYGIGDCLRRVTMLRVSSACASP